MIYGGIDPGLSGAIAFINEDESIHSVEDLNSSYKELIDKWKGKSIHSIYVENVFGRPGQSCTANTTFMKHAGKAELLAECICNNIVLVTPSIWKKSFGLITNNKLSKIDKKRLSIELANKIFNTDIPKNKDGRAEALLIALYGKRMMENKEWQIQ